MSDTRRKLLPEMEGASARWYAKLRATPPQLAAYRAQAAGLTGGLAPGSDVLEVAPGPGYLAIEIARLGHHVTGLDVSRSFVAIATEAAARAGVTVTFRQGDVAAMPFPAASFDLIVCQAAFKNFTRPVAALDEMHRVLRPGGTAVVQDMRGDATRADIGAEVAGMEAGPVSGLFTRIALTGLRRRAYLPARLGALVARSAFGTGEITTEGIGLEVRLRRSP
jgi:SAM-dependent methyltransferase